MDEKYLKLDLEEFFSREYPTSQFDIADEGSVIIIPEGLKHLFLSEFAEQMKQRAEDIIEEIDTDEIDEID